LSGNPLGTLTGVWVPHDTRDQIVDFVRRWSEETEIGAGRFIGWLDITASKFYGWRERYGKVNEHNGWVPRDSPRSDSAGKRYGVAAVRGYPSATA
jgi:hypothetical protein